ncbi:HNH endonuclease signature motif containing protein [Limosilactobacillus reuteri]|nr:HNH endonuclease signature motif containing protein [Limosilactobacillus reuteri]
MRWSAGGNSHKTRFKKGHIPKQYKSLGTLREARNGYTYIKVSDEGPRYQRWIPYQKYLWQQHYKRTLPEGMVILFLDGNKKNFAIENLAAVTRAESMYINHMGLHFDNTALSKTGMLIARVMMKIKEKGK